MKLAYNVYANNSRSVWPSPTKLTGPFTCGTPYSPAKSGGPGPKGADGRDIDPPDSGAKQPSLGLL